MKVLRNRGDKQGLIKISFNADDLNNLAGYRIVRSENKLPIAGGIPVEAYKEKERSGGGPKSELKEGILNLMFPSDYHLSKLSGGPYPIIPFATENIGEWQVRWFVESKKRLSAKERRENEKAKKRYYHRQL